MRPFRCAFVLAILAVVVVSAGCPAPNGSGSQAQPAAQRATEITLQPIKMDVLAKELQGHPGKIVVADVWAET